MSRKKTVEYQKCFAMGREGMELLSRYHDPLAWELFQRHYIKVLDYVPASPGKAECVKEPEAEKPAVKKKKGRPAIGKSGKTVLDKVLMPTSAAVQKSDSPSDFPPITEE